MNDNNTYILVQEHVPAGETVWNGYIGGNTTCTAPPLPEDGMFSLYEVADENNVHVGWHWKLEETN